MNEQSFDDVVMAAQVSPSHAAGFVHMRKASFDSLSALAQQPLAALASDPPTVLINRCLLFLLALPVAAPAVGLGTIAPNLHFLQNHQHIITVIALVQHHFGGPFRIHVLGFVVNIGRDFRICSPHCASVSGSVLVSPAVAGCRVTASTAPVSRSTACSALWARCVRPSFIFVICASGSYGFFQSSLLPFLFRLRSSLANCSRVGVSMPDSFASSFRKSS